VKSASRRIASRSHLSPAFGVITTAGEKEVPVDYGHFNIMGEWSAPKVSPRFRQAIFPNVNLEVHFGHDKG